MKTHCPQKHPYDEANTYVDKKGYYHCKTCRRERMQARRPATRGQGYNNAVKTHCPRNHEYTEENTYFTPKGSRACRTCMRANMVIQNLKRYGLTPEKLRAMLEDQDYRCAICPRSFHEFTPHIDHDHTCCPSSKACGNCVRGLLCQDCNRGLGQFHDDPTLLRAAAGYLG